MKSGLADIVGKEIAGAVVASRSGRPHQQLILTFTDGTYFEIWGDSFTCAGGVDRGSPVAAVAFASQNGGKVTAVYGNAGA